MSGHTPGPWTVDNHEPLLFGALRGGWMELIGFVYGTSRPECSEDWQRAIANARLIAASPLMLQELYAAVAQIEALGGDASTQRAAIAIAKGEA